MEKLKLFQYLILWHPTSKQKKDEDAKSKIIQEITNALASDAGAVNMKAAMSIPPEYKDELDQIEIVVRPF